MTKTDRITRLEKHMKIILRAVLRLCRWFGQRRVNAKSRTLSGPEAVAFQAQMAGHGLVDDDESRDEQPKGREVAR